MKSIGPIGAVSLRWIAHLLCNPSQRKGSDWPDPGGVADHVAILGKNTPTVARQSQNAEEIVKLLGSLSLAMSQAGAFMRSRDKDLEGYKKLFLKARSELLGFKPRLADSERTVLSTWELNFKQIEHDSKAAANLLLLLSFLEPMTIPEIVLHRGTMAQNRWNEEGEMVAVPAELEGVDRNLVQLIQNEMDFDAAIEKLCSFSIVSCSKDTNGSRNFSIHPLVQYCARQRTPSDLANAWRRQAILLICHAFPRNR